jgi:hypothetical protein
MVGQTRFCVHDEGRDALDGSNVSGYFVATLKEHGLRRIRFHDVRHLFASLALQAGSDIVRKFSTAARRAAASTTFVRTARPRFSP